MTIPEPDGATPTRRSLVKIAGLGVVVAGVASQVAPRVLSSGTAAARPTSPRELLQQRHLPNVALVTHRGQSVRFYDDLVKDKKVVISFLDYGRADSKRVVTNLIATHRLLGTRVGRDIHMYTVTLDPERDTPARLRSYARQCGNQSGWTHLTGRRTEVETLRAAIGFAYPDRTEDADRANVTSILRYGNEPEMRWAHATTLGNPDMIAHMIISEFGPDPDDPSGFFNFYCKLPTV